MKFQPCTSSTKPLLSSSFPLPPISFGFVQRFALRSTCAVSMPLSMIATSTVRLRRLAGEQLVHRALGADARHVVGRLVEQLPVRAAPRPASTAERRRATTDGAAPRAAPAPVGVGRVATVAGAPHAASEERQQDERGHRLHGRSHGRNHP